MDKSAAGQARRARTLADIDRLILTLEQERGGESEAERFERFERLAKLIAARSTAASEYRPRSNVFPALALALGAIVTLLQLRHVSDTELEIKAFVSCVTFGAAAAGDVTLPSRLTRLLADGISSLEIPSETGEMQNILASSARGLALLVAPEGEGKVRPGPLHPQTGDQIKLSFPSAHALQMRVAGAETQLKINVSGSVRVSAADLNTVLNYGGPESLVAESSRPLSITVSGSDWSQCVICSPLAIQDIQFSEDLQRAGSPDQIRSASAVSSGQIEFYEVPRQYPLHRGERLVVKLSKNHPTEIRELHVDPQKGTAEISLHAWVSSVQVGSRSSPVDLQPTVLEWLKSRHGPELAWVSYASLLGVLGGLWKWLNPGD